MEPLRVLELYSGVGGMHQALRGESAPSASIPAGRCSEVWLQRGEERRDAGGGDAGRRGGGGSVVLETAPAGRRLPLLCGGDSSSCPEPQRAQFLGPDPPAWALSHPTGNPRGGGASPRRCRRPGPGCQRRAAGEEGPGPGSPRGEGRSLMRSGLPGNPGLSGITAVPRE